MFQLFFACSDPCSAPRCRHSAPDQYLPFAAHDDVETSQSTKPKAASAGVIKKKQRRRFAPTALLPPKLMQSELEAGAGIGPDGVAAVVGQANLEHRLAIGGAERSTERETDLAAIGADRARDHRLARVHCLRHAGRGKRRRRTCPRIVANILQVEIERSDPRVSVRVRDVDRIRHRAAKLADVDRIGRCHAGRDILDDGRRSAGVEGHRGARAIVVGDRVGDAHRQAEDLTAVDRIGRSRGDHAIGDVVQADRSGRGTDQGDIVGRGAAIGDRRGAQIAVLHRPDCAVGNGDRQVGNGGSVAADLGLQIGDRGRVVGHVGLDSADLGDQVGDGGRVVGDLGLDAEQLRSVNGIGRGGGDRPGLDIGQPGPADTVEGDDRVAGIVILYRVGRDQRGNRIELSKVDRIGQCRASCDVGELTFRTDRAD